MMAVFLTTLFWENYEISNDDGRLLYRRAGMMDQHGRARRPPFWAARAFLRLLPANEGKNM